MARIAKAFLVCSSTLASLAASQAQPWTVATSQPFHRQLTGQSVSSMVSGPSQNMVSQVNVAASAQVANTAQGVRVDPITMSKCANKLQSSALELADCTRNAGTDDKKFCLCIDEYKVALEACAIDQAGLRNMQATLSQYPRAQVCPNDIDAKGSATYNLIEGTLQLFPRDIFAFVKMSGVSRAIEASIGNFAQVPPNFVSAAVGLKEVAQNLAQKRALQACAFQACQDDTPVPGGGCPADKLPTKCMQAGAFADYTISVPKTVDVQQVVAELTNTPQEEITRTLSNAFRTSPLTGGVDPGVTAQILPVRVNTVPAFSPTQPARTEPMTQTSGGAASGGSSGSSGGSLSSSGSLDSSGSLGSSGSSGTSSGDNGLWWLFGALAILLLCGIIFAIVYYCFGPKKRTKGRAVASSGVSSGNHYKDTPTQFNAGFSGQNESYTPPQVYQQVPPSPHYSQSGSGSQYNVQTGPQYAGQMQYAQTTAATTTPALQPPMGLNGYVHPQRPVATQAYQLPMAMAVTSPAMPTGPYGQVAPSNSWVAQQSQQQQQGQYFNRA